MSARQNRPLSERGQAMVLFAIILPVILAFGSVVLTVGNWWVHKRHLQTQVDAAAFAGGTEFWGCSSLFDPATANITIKARALEYAGDSLRPPSSMDPTFTAPVRNPQVQTPDDVRAVLNSTTWWAQGDPTDGTGLDDTIDPDGDPLTPGDPCSTRTLDVKATDDEAPTLWGWLPFVASPKTKARVEIRQVVEMSGMLPFAVPEIDPAAVVALFVNEDNPDPDPAILGYLDLCKPSDCPGLVPPDNNFSYWMTTSPSAPIDIPSENTSVIILISKNEKPPALNLSGTIGQICGQSPGLVRCHAGSSKTSGVNFIHGWADNPGQPNNPRIRDVSVLNLSCSDPSAPYFLNSADCEVGILANIDFGFTGDPVPNRPIGIGAQAWLHASANCGGSGDPLTGSWTSGTESTWTGGSKTINAASGRNPLSIEWQTRPNPGPGFSDCFNLVAAPYAADLASGPLEYVDISGTGPSPPYPPVIDSNSRNSGGPGHNITVTVGLNKPLAIEPPTNPPLLLRFASKSGSLNQALDCDAGIVFKDEIADGCQTRYRLNYFDWSVPPDGTYEWDDILCAGYPLPSDLPPPTFLPPPGTNAPNCVAAKTGDVVSMRQGLFERFQTNPNAPAGANGCWRNNWPAIAADIPGWIKSGGPANDPRYITLIITDMTAFTGSGAENVPVKYFGGFYAQGWDIGPAGGGDQTGCPDFDGPGPWVGNDPHPLGLNANRDNGDVWGHFVNFVVPLEADPSDTLCNFDEVGTCVAVLVE